MKNEQLKKLIKEEIKNLLESTPAVEGQAALLPLMKQLGIDGQKFTLAFNSIKQNKELSLQMKTILSDTMIALIKSNDDTLLQKIFTQLKKIGTTSNTSASDKTSTAPAPAPVR
jgi:inactivated superfamily I helicase